jgi:hypothetical protein
MEPPESAVTKALRLAQEENLCLLPANTPSGYKCVQCRANRFIVNVHMQGKTTQLGSYSTAPEAALAYARHIGPARCAVEARRPPPSSHKSAGSREPCGFGLAFGQPSGDQAIVAYADDDDEGDGHVDAEAITVVSTVAPPAAPELPPPLPPPPPPATGAGGSGVKRRRRVVQDEYELELAPPTDRVRTQRLDFEVPAGARRASVTVVYHFN